MFNRVPSTLERVPPVGIFRGDYEANGAVQMALDEFDCGLEEHPPGCFGWVELFASVMTQDAREEVSWR